MATKLSDTSLEWRALLFLNMKAAGQLNDETLPAEDFSIVQNRRFSDWPDALKKRLEPYGTAAIAAADQQAS